jgi:hypothetical protein
VQLCVTLFSRENHYATRAGKQLTGNQLSQDEIQMVREFARTVRQGLQLATDNFEAKRKIIDFLDVQLIIAVENIEKAVYAKCLIGDTTMTNISRTIGGSLAEPGPCRPC